MQQKFLAKRKITILADKSQHNQQIMPLQHYKDLSVTLVDSQYKPNSSVSSTKIKQSYIRSQYFPTKQSCLTASGSTNTMLKNCRSLTTLQLDNNDHLYKSTDYQLNSPQSTSTKSFKRYFVTLKQSEQRLQSSKFDKDKIQSAQSIQAVIKKINEKQQSTVSQRLLTKLLQQTLKKLEIQKQKNGIILKQKEFLEKQLKKIELERNQCRNSVRWYENYAKDKDFEAKGVYWKSYFQNLQKHQDNKKLFRNFTVTELNSK